MGIYQGKGGNFSEAFPGFHVDSIPLSLVPVQCPAFAGMMFAFQANPNNTGNVTVGSSRLAITGAGIVLGAGEWSPWFPVKNLDRFWHVDDAGSTLTYVVLY